MSTGVFERKTVTAICPICGQTFPTKRPTGARCRPCQNRDYHARRKGQELTLTLPPADPLMIGWKLRPIMALVTWQAARDMQGLDEATEEEQREAAEWMDHFAADILDTAGITMQGFVAATA
jgi:hypothetical protein